MILINLLPYRELAREKQRKQFTQQIVLFALLGAIVSGGIWFYLDSVIATQRQRNTQIQNAIDEAKSQEARVTELRTQKEQLLAKKKKVEELQILRGMASKSVSAIEKALPPGLYLTNLTTSGNGYALTGMASSENRIAVFMSNLPKTGMFNAPILSSIKKEGNGQVFALKVEFAPPGTAPQTISVEDAEQAVSSAVAEAASAEAAAIASAEAASPKTMPELSPPDSTVTPAVSTQTNQPTGPDGSNTEQRN